MSAMTPLENNQTLVAVENTVNIYNKVFERKKHEDREGNPCIECGAKVGEYHNDACKKEKCPACGRDLQDCLSELKQRAPFEKVFEELGHTHDDASGIDTCQIAAFETPFTDLYLQTDGVSLYRGMHVSLFGASNKKLLEFLNLFNEKATVTRFFISDRYPDDYIHAEAVYHGEFDHDRFKAFVEHWYADILPVPDSVTEAIRDEKLRQRKANEEFWRIVKKGK